MKKAILSFIGRALAALASLISSTATAGWEGEIEPPTGLSK